MLSGPGTKTDQAKRTAKELAKDEPNNLQETKDKAPQVTQELTGRKPTEKEEAAIERQGREVKEMLEE